MAVSFFKKPDAPPEAQAQTPKPPQTAANPAAPSQQAAMQRRVAAPPGAQARPAQGAPAPGQAVRAAPQPGVTPGAAQGAPPAAKGAPSAAKGTGQPDANQALALAELHKKLQVNERFRAVSEKIHSSVNTDELILKVKDEILNLIDADRITIFGIDPTKNELYSKFLTPGMEVKEIRVPISTSSLAGYSAYSKDLINISDVYDDVAVKKVNGRLNFDRSWDQKTGYRTKQVLAVPITNANRLYGVVQLINTKNGSSFTKDDEDNVLEICKVLGTSLHNQSKMINTRFNFLVTMNKLTEEELKRAMALARETSKEVETILMEQYKITKNEIGLSLGQFYGCRFVEYTDKMLMPKELATGLNPALLKKSFWAPIAQVEGKVIVAIDNPNDTKVGEIKKLLKEENIEFAVALKEDILKFIDGLTKEEEHLTEESLSAIMNELDLKDEDTDANVITGLTENASAIVRLVNQLLIEGYNKGASDIHIEPNKSKKTLDVRYRIDGSCIKHLEAPYSYSGPLVSRLKIISGLNIAERRLPQDGKIKFIYKGKTIEFRVATLPTVGGEDVVLRILASSEPLPLEVLNLSRRDFEVLKKIIIKPYGLILVVGPTGSGKTTTLHSALGFINTPEKKIWTAEDPVEISQYGLRQVEVKPKIGFDFARAMRAFLRADPDVVMVGEMRDQETAHIGIEASLTGHLVFSTLHTNSAHATITRLVDMGLDPFNFADALLGIVAQRLCRTLCKDCKEPYYPTKEEFDELISSYDEGYFQELNIEYHDKLILYKSRGCSSCNNTGYKGRMGIYELLEATPDMKKIIQSRSKMELIREQAIKDGMRSLFSDGISKVFQGLTDIAMVRKVCM